MQLIRLFVSFAGLVATASAVDIRLCKDQNLGGACYATTIASGSCWNVPGDYNDVISSYVVERQCTFFEHGSCEGASFVGEGVQYTVPSSFNDRISSLSC